MTCVNSLPQRSADEEAHAAFWATLDVPHREQVQRLCELYGGGDFDESCLGFLGAYRLLSRLIPLDRTIYDVGCAYAFQAWFFRHHASYIGIAPTPLSMRFHAPNTMHYLGTVEEWARYSQPADPHFAVHNYVPAGRDTVVRVFRDVYVFYPQFSQHFFPRLPEAP